MRRERQLGVAILAAAGAWILAGASGAQAADEVRTVRSALVAEDAFEKGMGAWGVRRGEKGGIVLYDHVLIEDDGPGIGSDARWMTANRSPVLEIGGQRVAKKVLVVDRPEAQSARMYVRGGFQIELNGKPVERAGGGEYVEVPVGLIRKGENTVILRKDGNAASIKVAERQDILRNAPDRKDRPGRSWSSDDGGKTWTPVDGEILVRLHLVQNVETGHFVSPVIDMARAGEEKEPLPGAVAIQSVALKAEADAPPGTGVELTWRAGTTPVYEEASWGPWQAPGTKAPAGCRYLQWKATLKSSSPTATPTLKGVAAEASVVRAPLLAWAGAVRVTDARNEEIRYTSIPYEYEDPQHPMMVSLRKKYALDDVVKDANSELEKLVRLRDWVVKQWRFKAPGDYYPAWDADDILQHKTGFCVQFAIVYMQCATALGYQTRFVFGHGYSTGHEVTEVWSNQYDKWVYMDNSGNFHQVDPRTNVPMSMIEVHDLIVKTYYGEGAISRENRPRSAKTSPAVASCHGLELAPGKPRKPTADGLFEVPTKWQHMYMMPRNNFFSRQNPVPKTQGTTWDYSDYQVWAEPQLPVEWEYRNFTGRRSDWEWTINRVRFGAALGEKAGTIQVQMGTVTPGLETFLVSANGKGWEKAGAKYAWELQAGKNRLEMRIRNTSGVEGPVSHLEVQYKP